jgi:glyoxylase-like metal-dependent hydrolase (beta-lactamase superfamily II)
MLLAIVVADASAAQTLGFSAPSLEALRRAAAMVPGAAPTAINVVTLAPGRFRRSDWVDTPAEDSITFGLTVFQIRFPEGWITVDAASDRDLMSSSRTFSDAVYGTIQDALRDARLSLLTHEHWDHARGVLRSPHLAEVQRHTMLTRAQVQTLLSAPPDAKVRMDSATATRYLVVDYDGILPVAPGVVLIKAAGHTPGSQMIYVCLASGKEVVLAGDVAWNMSGVLEERLKPAETLRRRNLTEDQVAVAAELRWLKTIGSRGVAVLVSHDIDRIAGLARQGLLGTAFDLSRK